MIIPDKAVEAAKAVAWVRYGSLPDKAYIRTLLTAAAPFIAAPLEAEVAYQMARAAYFKYVPEIDQDPEGVARLRAAMREARDNPYRSDT